VYIDLNNSNVNLLLGEMKNQMEGMLLLMSRGVVYVATGNGYIEEAIKSASQLKKIMPTMPITAFLSEELSCPYFDRVIKINDPQYGFIDKVKYMYRSPYDETLFLDTDTFVSSGISPLFELLKNYEIAAPSAPIDDIVPSVPDAFHEMNSGVILFKKSEAVRACFEDWLDFHVRNCKISVEQPPDQPAFREAVYKNKIRSHFLSHEYNCMISYPVFLSGKVSIFHGRSKHLKQVMDVINKFSDKVRIYIPNMGVFIQEKESTTIHPIIL
jgi:hypothetical protein